MRITLFISFIVLITYASQAQWGASYQYSSIRPNISVSYGALDQWWGEFRMSTDINANNFSMEFLGAHNFIKRDLADLYGGVGIKTNTFTGPMAVVGLNTYPFNKNNFSILLESGFIYDTDTDQSIFRGLFGFRYIFGNTNEDESI